MPRASRLALALALGCLTATAAAAPASADITVSSTADQGPGTLRQAIADASAGETIVVPASSAHYAVTSSELQIAQDLTIAGGGARGTFIDATGGSNRVFEVTGGTVTIRGVTIRGGTADFGAGVRNLGTLTLRNDAIVANHATDSYGGVENLGDLSLFESTLAHNVADGQGGGLGNVSSGTATVENTTIARNRAGPHGDTQGGAVTAGGGVEMGGASMFFFNSTIARNEAAGFGGGIHDGGNAGTDQSLQNTIVADNVAGDQGKNCNFLHPDNFQSFGGNVADDASCNLDKPNDQVADPLLGRLRNNGGQTNTFALLPGSAAIDHGSLGECALFDQRHVHRPLDGDADGHAVCDSGAFEAPVPKPNCSLDVVSKRVFGHTFTDANGHKHVKGALNLRGECDQAVQLRLTGTIVARRPGHPKRTFTLHPLTTSAGRFVTKPLRPTLPHVALRLLRHGAHESAALVLVGRNAHGSGRATAAIDRLQFVP